MKIQKIDGLYRKPRLKPTTKVPFILWAPFFLVIVAVLIGLVLQSNILLDQTVPDIGSIRKHAYRVAAVGDIACSPESINFNEGEGVVNGCQQKAVGLAVERENTDAVFLLGDIQYDTGEFKDFERSFVPYWREVQSPLYIAMGNHDYGNGTRSPADANGLTKAFDTYFTNAVYEREEKSYYDVSLGQWDIFFLDSNCEYINGCSEGSGQYHWLTRQVTDSTAQCSIAVWHHPTATSGVHKEPDSTARGVEFTNYLKKNGVDLILNGHDHHYERIINGTTRQFIAGTGGMSLRKATAPFAEGSEKIIDDSFGYLYLELYPGRYTWEFKNPIGEVLDSGEDTCK